MLAMSPFLMILPSLACGGVKTGMLLGIESSGSGGTNGDGLYDIDIDTGLATVIDLFPMDPSDGALAVAPDGTLYAAFASIAHLIIVNPETGQLTDVGAFGFDDVSGLAFGLEGTLYGHDDATCQLITIDIATGAGTAVGEVGFTGGGGLAVSPVGVLYALGKAPGEDPSLWIIDVETAQGTQIGFLGTLYGFDPIDSALGLEFVGDTLYASVDTLNEGIGALVRVDTLTGDAALEGQFSEDGTQSMTGMAFLPGAGDADRDGDADLDDFARFQACFTGPEGDEPGEPDDPPLPVECQFLDTDKDRDIDLIDFASFQNGFTGPNEE